MGGHQRLPSNKPSRPGKEGERKDLRRSTGKHQSKTGNVRPRNNIQRLVARPDPLRKISEKGNHHHFALGCIFRVGNALGTSGNPRTAAKKKNERKKAHVIREKLPQAQRHQKTRKLRLPQGVETASAAKGSRRPCCSSSVLVSLRHIQATYKQRGTSKTPRK